MEAPAWVDHPPHLIPRAQMPQIAPEDLTAFFEWLAWRGVKVQERTLEPVDLMFHQRVSMARINAMEDWAYRTPILVSIEPWVLDGNHRAVAHKLRGEPIQCLQLVASFSAAMRELFAFAGTTQSRGEPDV